MKLFLIFLLAVTCEARTCREQAIEDTLMTTLAVGAEMREKHLHPSWQQLQDEVRKRLYKPRKQTRKK